MGVCRCVRGRTSSRHVSSEERGAAKSPPAVLLGSASTARCLLERCWEVRAAAALPAPGQAPGQASPAHRDKVPLRVGLSDCRVVICPERCGCAATLPAQILAFVAAVLRIPPFGYTHPCEPDHRDGDAGVSP